MLTLDHAFPPHSQSHSELFFPNKDRIAKKDILSHCHLFQYFILMAEVENFQKIFSISTSASMEKMLAEVFSWRKERYSTVQICKHNENSKK